MAASAIIFPNLIRTRVYTSTRLYLTLGRRYGSNLHHDRPYSFFPMSSSFMSPTFHQHSPNHTQTPRHGSIFPIPACSLYASSLPIPSPRSNSFALWYLPTAFQCFRYYSASEIGFKSDTNDGVLYRWRMASGPIDGGAAGFAVDRGSTVTVVLLGWLGGRPKHLDKYTNLYVVRGFNVVTFAVPVSDLFGFVLGRKLECRIQKLTEDLVAWLMKSDVQPRRLVIHAFSNTGWLVYGTILGYLDNRPEILASIKGLIVDSGAGSPLSPKVWAGGFGTAMLKYSRRSIAKFQKRDPTTSTSVDKLQEKEPQSTSEILLLFLLEKLFSVLLLLPYLRSTLSGIVSRLSEDVHCPQLYLYSTADKLIPYTSVEMYIAEQRIKRRKVWFFNFETSPHVDHYRNFPDLYSSKVNSFLDECVQVCQAQGKR